MDHSLAFFYIFIPMTTSTLNSLAQILGRKSSNLGQILAKVRALQNLTLRLREWLAPEIAAQCCVANLRENCLVIQVDNAAVATHLQYQSAELLSKFRTPDNLPSLANLKIIVRPAIE